MAMAAARGGEGKKEIAAGGRVSPELRGRSREVGSGGGNDEDEEDGVEGWGWKVDSAIGSEAAAGGGWRARSKKQWQQFLQERKRQQ
jgi:hypothetical protein